MSKELIDDRTSDDAPHIYRLLVRAQNMWFRKNKHILEQQYKDFKLYDGLPRIAPPA